MAKVVDEAPLEDLTATSGAVDGDRPNRGRQRWLAVGLLLAVVGLTHFNILFLGQTLVATANYSPFDDRVTHLRPTVMGESAFGGWHDAGGTWWQWEPAAVAFSDALRLGEWPLWDPTLAGGVDAHVNLVAGQYFPPYLPVLLLGNTPSLRDAYYLAIVLASGLGMAGLLLRNGFHLASATTGGVAYMLCGAVTQTANSNLGQATAMLPLLLLVTDWLLERPSGPRFSATAAVIATTVLAGFLPVVFSGFLLVALLALAHAALPGHAGTGGKTEVRRRLDPLVIAAGAGLLGLALAAFLLFPIQKASAGSADFSAWYAHLGRQAYSPDELLTLVSPLLSWDVNQTQLDAHKVFLPRNEWQSHFFHVGLVVMLLASMARWLERPAYRRLLLAFALMSGVVLAKLLGLPPVQWLAELPVLRYTHFIPYFCAALALGLSGLAACGVESMAVRVPSLRDLIAGSAVIAVVLGGLVAFSLVRGFNPAAPGKQYLRWAFEADRVVVAAVGVLVVLWLRRQGLLAGRRAGFVVLGLVVLELGPLACHRRYGRVDVWRDVPEYVRFLQGDKERFRIHGVHDLALTPNVFQGLGLEGLGSRAVFNQPRFTALVKSAFKTAQASSFLVPTQLLPSQRVVLDLLNVKYLLTHAPTVGQRSELTAAGLEEVAKDGNFVIFRNPTCWPRAYLAKRYRVVGGVHAALEAVTTLKGPEEVILEERPTFESGSGSAPDAGTCRITGYRADDVTLEVDSSGPAIVVLLDSLAPGWSAKINGTPARIVPANSAFRGVEVPVGRSLVTMQYRTPGLRFGLAVSGFALVAVVICLIPAVRRKWSERPTR